MDLLRNWIMFLEIIRDLNRDRKADELIDFYSWRFVGDGAEVMR